MIEDSGATRPHSTNETVLVAESEVLVRVVISDYLRRCGYKVIEAANGDEALAILMRADIEVDVVFSDVELAGAIDGFRLSQWVHDNRPGLGVVLTGTVARAVNAAASLCEQGPMLQKPYEPQDALDQIKRLLAGRSKRVRE